MSMPGRERLRCSYCLGRERLPEVQHISSGTPAQLGEWQIYLGCDGTGQLDADDGAGVGGAAGWEDTSGRRRNAR
jgi:hypothetical protein